MYFVRTRYKIYEWSKRATVFSVLGGILKSFCWIAVCFVIMLLIAIPTAANPDYKEYIKVAIPVALIVGIILAIIGGKLQKKAERLGQLDFENKVKNDFLFAKKMAKKNPENKEWFISQNSEYADYVLSGKENLETDEDDSDVKNIPIWRKILGVVLIAVFIFGGMYLLRSLD